MIAQDQVVWRRQQRQTSGRVWGMYEVVGVAKAGAEIRYFHPLRIIAKKYLVTFTTMFSSHFCTVALLYVA